jgi:hypothetical protein
MPMKDFRGVAGSTPSSNPNAKPTEGSAKAPSASRWQGAYDSTVSSNPNEKPPGSAKIPGGGK